jgi:hypothetical protein
MAKLSLLNPMLITSVERSADVCGKSTTMLLPGFVGRNSCTARPKSYAPHMLVRGVLADKATYMVAILEEFIGTTMFLFFAFAGTQVANIGPRRTMDNSTTGAATEFKYVFCPVITLCQTNLFAWIVPQRCYKSRFVLASV